MRLTIVLVALMAISAAATSVKPLTEEEHFLMFNGWIKEHGKSYPTIHEFEKRYSNFKATVELVRKHQANPARKWEMAVNKFADLTSKEFFEQYLMPNIKTRLPTNRKVANFSGLRAPDSVDWVAAGKVSGVKDQGQCGSCWSFSTTGAIESAYAIENSASPPSLSEQELVDCSSSSGNQGCNGGYPDDAFSWVTSNGGLCTEDAYPYTGTDGTCSSSSCSSAYTISSYTDVTQDSEDDLANAVANQPVSVLVDASQGWQTYAGGILDSSSGCSTNLDHAVLAVGYGSDNGEEYWTIKNSWGTSWGESGYIRLQKGVGGAGTCGVASQCSFPTGASQVSGKTRRHKGFYRV